jgi:hypothetical protein
MDEYQQVGPEKPGYAEDVVGVAKHLGRNGVVDVKFAARGTMKHIVLALLHLPGEVMSAGVVNYGGRPEGFWEQPGIFVGIDGGKAAWLPATGDLHPAYVQGYLGQSFGVDPMTGYDDLTNFVNDVARYIYGAWWAAKEAGVLV